MKKALFFIVLTLCLSILPAQYINAYINAGATTAQIEGDELKGFSHWGPTAGVGALIRFDNTGTWSLSLETDYTARGVYNNLNKSDNLYNINMSLHYVDIPLTLHFKDPYGGLRIGLGLVYGRLIAQPHGTIEFRPSYFYPDTNDLVFLNNDLSAAAELRFPLWQRLQLSVRYQRSLFPIKKNWTFTQDEGKATEQSWQNDCFNSSVSLRLIWQFGEQEKNSRHKSANRRSHSHNKPRVKVHRR